MKIAIIGGTGKMGYGLGLRLALAGHSIFIGSRDAAKALAAQQSSREHTGCPEIYGTSNVEAAQVADLVVISVPAAGHFATVENLAEIIRAKNVLDITVPIAFKPLRYSPPPAGSNALETAQILGDGCRVAAGFHTISALLLEDIQLEINADTLIVGNNQELKDLAIQLAAEIGLQAYDAGSLLMSPTVESLTPMLIGMNKRYGSNHMGIRIEGA
jgi:NADPH-dependent F420 reductase